MDRTGGVFDQGKEELLDTLRQGPAAHQAEPPEPTTIPPSQWHLDSIRAAVPRLSDYTLSGVWRVLQRYGLKLRTARVQQYSPDPQYKDKLRHLLTCLRQTAQDPTETVLVFLDEMGYYRWPEVTQVWATAAPAPAPQADRHQAKQQQWRLIGALNASTGQVDYLDGYIVGRAKVIQMYQHLVECYPQATRIYVARPRCRPAGQKRSSPLSRAAATVAA